MEQVNRKCQVIMLATDKKSKLVLDHIADNNPLFQWSNNVERESTENYTAQHLYILSDDEIKEGDWYWAFSSNYGEGYKAFKCKNEYREANEIGVKKVIATTNPDLNLPSISQSDIQWYISEYNKGNIIEEVMVEFEFEWNQELAKTEMINSRECYIPKLAKDDTIIIHSLKDSFTIEDLEKAFNAGKNDGWYTDYGNIVGHKLYFNDWFNQQEF